MGRSPLYSFDLSHGVRSTHARSECPAAISMALLQKALARLTRGCGGRAAVKISTQQRRSRSAPPISSRTLALDTGGAAPGSGASPQHLVAEEQGRGADHVIGGPSEVEAARTSHRDRKGCFPIPQPTRARRPGAPPPPAPTLANSIEASESSLLGAFIENDRRAHAPVRSF